MKKKEDIVIIYYCDFVLKLNRILLSTLPDIDTTFG